MENKSISDIIEAYLKEILGDSAQVEIRRSEIANQFDVVPSQINYVIKTRFTIQNGYLDIGIIDTMKDLLVNFIGALVFSILGLFYIKNRNKYKFAENFIPKLRRKKA